MSGFRRIGRNEPCPCGSGRKYKQCCLPREEAFLQARGANADLTELLVRALRIPEVWPSVERAWGQFWRDDPPQPLETALAAAQQSEESAELFGFLDWVLHDARLGDEGATVLDIATRAAPPESVDPETLAGRLLAGRRGSMFSAFQVTRADPGRSIWLRDVFTDETFEVWDQSMSETAAPGDVVIQRLRPLAGVYEAAGDGWSFGAPEVRPLRDWAEPELARLRESQPQAGWRDLWRQRGELLYQYAIDRRRHPRLPQMFTTTGEPLVLCTATWGVTDAAAVTAGLDAAGGGLRREDGQRAWVWTPEPGDDRWRNAGPAGDGGPAAAALVGGPSLGALRLDDAGETLTLECMSEKRLLAGRDLVEAAAGSHLAFQGDQRRSPAEMLASRGAQAQPAAPPDIPPDVLKQVAAEFIEKYERQWIGEPLPALGGKTAKQAAGSADPTLRRKLADVLLEIENAERRFGDMSDTGAGMSAARLRLLLGL